MPGLRQLCTLAEALVDGAEGGRAVLGIAGEPGAGKSTLVRLLLGELTAVHGQGWAAHLPMDGFHLADAQLARLGLTDRKGAPETFDVEGYAALLHRVRRPAPGSGPVYAPGFERDLEQPLAAALHIPPTARLVLTEGNYLLLRDDRWRAARAQLDAVWWVAVDAGVRQARLVSRHEAWGKGAERARAWVARVDEVNASTVRDRSDPADLVLRETDTGWSVRSG
ncbi:nucleoside/nucleotide kinase family protein [Serinicoccus kebangsaanensis]|uniref:nucleoside/nucleotide kinase family protein n=1 Tax=Serinicoccus kebangsaanensis TaxID=2602069 RepID=UPI00124DFD19|nr:nucleoside/nucleotide kinase family protein [Serinicoccus kebangsaanensis]